MDSLRNIEDFNLLFSSPTLHPQVSVIELVHIGCRHRKPMVCNMYGLILYSNGSLLTIRPGQTVEIEPDSDTPEQQGWMLVFQPDLLEKTGLGRDFYMFSYFQSDYSEAIVLTEVEHKVIRNCFANLYAELHTKPDYLSGQMIRLGIGTLLSYVKRYFEKQYTCTAMRTETLAGRLDSLLSRYLGSGQPAQQGQPSVGWCAAQLGLSSGYFSDMIKKELHITAQEYIRSKIIAQAQVLLRQTNMTINEIAEELGFRYPNHFTRMFHKATGFPPLKYRKG